MTSPRTAGNNRRNNKLKKMDSNQEKALKMAFIIHCMYKSKFSVFTSNRPARLMMFESQRYFPYLKAKTPRVPNLRGFFFLGGAVTFTLGPCCSLLWRIPDKNDRCAFTRGSRGEVMIFFEKNNVLGVEPNRVYREIFLKTTWSTKRFVKGECTLIYDCFILPCCFFPTSFAFQRMYHVCPKFSWKNIFVSV
jgi:hypothetical protein